MLLRSLCKAKCYLKFARYSGRLHARWWKQDSWFLDIFLLSCKHSALSRYTRQM